MATVTVGTTTGTMTNAQLKSALDAAIGVNLTRQGPSDSRIFRCVDNLVIQGSVNVNGFTFICADGKNVTFVGTSGGTAEVVNDSLIGGVCNQPTTIIFEGTTGFGEHDVTQETMGFFRNCGANIESFEIIAHESSTTYNGLGFLTSKKVIIKSLSIQNNNPNGRLYTNFNLTHADSSIKIKRLRGSTLRLVNNFDISFIGSDGWGFGEGGGQNVKLLSPHNSVISGLAPKFQDSTGVIELTSPTFVASTRTFLDSFLTPTRIGMHPPNNNNAITIIKRTITFNPISPTGAQLSNVSVLLKSNRTILGSAGVPAGETILFNGIKNYGGSEIIQVYKGWNVTQTYTTNPINHIDDSVISILFRSKDRLEATQSFSGYEGAYSATSALAPDNYYTSDQSANTTIAVNSSLKTITLSGANSLDNLYDYMKYWLTQNMSVANMLSPSGKTLDIADYKIIGLEFLTSGTKLDTIKSSVSHQANAAFTNIKIDGSVTQATATTLSSVGITGSLGYNDNTSKSVTFTNAVIGTVSNSGTGIITITKVGTTSTTTYTDAEINYLDSTLSFDGITSLTFYPTQADRDSGTNAGATASASPYNFKFGSTVNGVLLSGTVYLRINASGVLFLGEVNLALGDNALSLSDNTLLQAIVQKLDKSASNLTIVNEGVKKASLLIPHTTNLPA